MPWVKTEMRARAKNDAGRVFGIVCEADLMRRVEVGSENIRPWRLEAMTLAVKVAEESAWSDGKRAEAC
jgi:hypothetical protein